MFSELDLFSEFLETLPWFLDQSEDSMFSFVGDAIESTERLPLIAAFPLSLELSVISLLCNTCLLIFLH